MDSKSTFNVAVCVISIALLFIHTLDLFNKKNRRKDENRLLGFIIFTAVHFIAYLTFTYLKLSVKNDAFIMSFYTAFYIMNNIEVLLFVLYVRAFYTLKKRTILITDILNYSIFGIFVLLDIINIFNRMFFTSIGGVYQRADAMIVSQIYQFIAFAGVFLVTVFNKKLKPVERFAFFTYCVLPFVAIIIQNHMPGYAIAYLSVTISIEVLFLFVNVRKNMQLAEEAQKNKEAEVKIMMSQIQPHFIYNTLASISTLIMINPEEAQKGLDDFTEYLRANLSSLSDTGLILFSDELRHIETYLSLEKMRFSDRLNIVYDIQVKDFMVPPLSVQPIVENAVKHGILKKIEGGTVNIKTYEKEDAYVVEVSDDGVGFDTSEEMGQEHVGLSNVKFRISSMVHGEVKVDSEIDKGTKVTVLFYK